MSRVRLRTAISLDGFSAGPNQSKDHPLGEGGPALHTWAFGTRAMRRHLGLPSAEEGETGPSDDVLVAAIAGAGATVMGRNMFGPVRGAWDSQPAWNGWWGEEPPFHHPVFVLTHHPRAPLSLKGTTFHFVTDGLATALARAREAAGGQDVIIGGGAQLAQQCLKAGVVDDLLLHQVPVLLGAGERFFEGVTDLHGLVFKGLVAAPGVTHLRFAR